MNFGFSGEMIFLFFLALILFGPRRLPEIGRQIGRIMNEFRRASNEFRSQIESEINSLDVQKQQILPAIRDIKEPLGSLASRILNPPAPVEPTKAAENRIPDAARAAESEVAEAESVSTPIHGHAASSEPPTPPVPAAEEAGFAPSSAISSKAAPDA